MNTVMETILTRRSVRKYTEEPIPKELLEDLAKAAACAPSGHNCQTWQFTVITNKGVIQKLIDVIGKELNNPDYNMYHPTALILTSNLRDGNWSKEDNACALENVFLAAHSYGIGSVWINQLRDISDRPAVRAVLNELQVPEDHTVFGMAALGYPAPDAPVKKVEHVGKINYIE